MKTFIYGLHLGDFEIRYVGKSDNPSLRLKRHIYQCSYNSTHKNNWIKKSISDGKKLEFIILEEVDIETENWSDREKYWMSKFDNLTNTTAGGLGGSGKIYEISYDDCKKWVFDNMPIKSKTQWYKNTSKLPNFIPRNPREVFLKNGWISWGNFLGTNSIQDNIISLNYLHYDDAKNWIKNNISCVSSLEWKKLNIKNIPNRPERYYKNRGWISWADFLSNDSIIQNQKKEFLSYDDCVDWIKKNYIIKTHNDWKKYRIEFPNFIPTNPNIHFNIKGTWNGWVKFFNDIN